MSTLDIFTSDPVFISSPARNLEAYLWRTGELLPSGLSGLPAWSDFFKPPKVSDTLSKNKNDLIATYRSLLGSQDTLKQLRDRANVYVSNAAPDIRARAQAVVASLNGLLSNYDTLTVSYQDLARRLDQMIQNPPVTSLQQVGGVPGSSEMLGVYAQQKYASNANLILSIGVETTALITRIQDFKKNVKQGGENVDDLESLAQGKGLTATLKGIGSGVGSGFQTITRDVLVVGTGLLFLWALGPSFLKRIRS